MITPESRGRTDVLPVIVSKAIAHLPLFEAK